MTDDNLFKHINIDTKRHQIHVRSTSSFNLLEYCKDAQTKAGGFLRRPHTEPLT